MFGRSGGIPSLGHEDEGVLGLDFGLGGLGGAIIGILLVLGTQTVRESQVDFTIASVSMSSPP